MKKAVRRAGFILSGFAAASILIFLAAHYIFYPSEINPTRIRGFYLEQENSLDLVALGSSNVAQGISPVEGYLKTGLTSYAYATDAATVGDWIPMTEEILKNQNPQLLLVEVNGALYYESDPLYDSVWTRVLTDGMESGEAREQLISAITENPKEQLFYRYPFLYYHGKFEAPPYRITERIQHRVQTENRGYLLMKGYAPVMRTFLPGTLVDLTNQEPIELASNYESCLREYLDYCKEKNIQVLFFRMPTCVAEGDDTNLEMYRKSLSAGEIIREYGYPYLDLQQLSDEIGLNMETDFADPSHLNSLGNHKTTDYLYEYVKQQYGVTPSAGEKGVTAEWDDCTEFYEAAIPCIEEATKSCQVNRADLKDEKKEKGSTFREIPSTIRRIKNGEGIKS
ncbi:MAG: hypothetical protein Q4B15_02595 [Lachnospiraceae bacterium]|nr:hypothetical protein [Lachnospiraceae bacterium]